MSRRTLLAVIFVAVLSVFTLFPRAARAAGNTYYVATSGSDANPGTQASPFRTIQKAAGLAGAGDKVEILPGIYRETVTPANSGSLGNPVVFEAASGPGTVFIYGSVNSKNLAWASQGNGVFAANVSGFTAVPRIIYEEGVTVADLTGWPSTPEVNTAKQVNDGILKYPIARQPNFTVDTYWKYHANWWKADGGTLYSLTDAKLRNLPDLTGATIFMLDTYEAYYGYRRTITSYSASTGTVYWSARADFDYMTGKPGVGAFTKYYIEGKAAFLDQSTEWYVSGSTLYVKTRTGVSPTNLDLEIGNRGVGFNLTHRSYVTLRNLNISFINPLLTDDMESGAEGAVTVNNTSGSPGSSSYLTLEGLTIAHSGKGIKLDQESAGSGYKADHFTLRNSHIYDIEGYAFSALTPVVSGLTGPYANMTLINNEIDHAGFRPVSWTGHGVYIQNAYKLVIDHNSIHDIAEKAIALARKMGDYILVKDNDVERAMLNYAEGAVGTFSSTAEGWPKTLFIGNFVKDTVGWTFASEQAWLGNNPVGVQAENGIVGMGINQDNSYGATFYRNYLINTGRVGIDGKGNVYNNDFVGNFRGTDPWPPVDGAVIKNNIFYKNNYGLRFKSAPVAMSNVQLDYNLYGQNIVDLLYKDYLNYATVTNIRSNTIWEAHGLENGTTPLFINPAGTTKSDFGLAAGSKAIGVGTPPTPVLSLISELSSVLGYPISDVSPRAGVYDIGAAQFAPPTSVPGDLNGDGHVNILDLRSFFLLFPGTYSLSDLNKIVTNFGK